MKFSKLALLFSVLVLITLAHACKDDDGDGPDLADCSETRSYSADVVPIINKSCAIETCHVVGFNFGDFTTYDDLKAQDVAGKLMGQIENNVMPPSNSPGPKELTASEKNTLLCWIAGGALDN